VFRAGQVAHSLLGLLQATAGAVGSLVALAALQPLLLPLALLAVMPGAMLSGRRADAYYRFAFSLTPRDRERGYLAQILTERDAAKEVRAMGLAGFLRRRHDALNDERITELEAVTRRQLKWALAAGFATSAIVGVTLALLLALALDNRLPLPAAAAAAGAMILLGQRLAYGGFSAEALLEAALFIEDYLAFIALAPDAAAPAEPRPAPTPVGPVAAEEVWFSYPGAEAPTLKGVSLRIEPGEVVALVGANGSGKTTLAKLLAALYLPDRGRVVLHGADAAKADREALRRQVAVVFQDFIRYQLPARDNIALGRHERYADDDAVTSAARRAGAADDIEALPVLLIRTASRRCAPRIASTCSTAVGSSSPAATPSSSPARARTPSCSASRPRPTRAEPGRPRARGGGGAPRARRGGWRGAAAPRARGAARRGSRCGAA
jgi:ATP-binding cassette subfamily B protein